MSSKYSFFDDLFSPSCFNFFGNDNSLDLDFSDQRGCTAGTHRRVDVAWLKECTEILGSESGDHFTAEEEQPAESVVVLVQSSSSNTAGISRSYSASITRVESKNDDQDFPPEYLSTLNRYGRPRFILKKTRVSNDGGSLRLLITMERDQRPRFEPYFRSGDRKAAVIILRRPGSRGGEIRELKDFPPLLSKLDRNGRLRFTKEVGISDERLSIVMERIQLGPLIAVDQEEEAADQA
ncbi:hypothetical protein M0R45_010954 [Rubus argutus]|uniref:Uncharacterized protein n=1 Tax=Rubus argutus TaxID=59490 RepID=A0AAW1YCB7_RUBAR